MNSSNNIPGYTGFIPYKREFFGSTTCQNNKSAEYTYRTQHEARDFATIGKTILEL